MTPDKWKEQLDYIMDTFTGADGGKRYVNLKAVCQEMERQYNDGNHTAGMVLDKSLSTFVRFIEAAQEFQHEK
jgi:hypothetical protein